MILVQGSFKGGKSASNKKVEVKFNFATGRCFHCTALNIKQALWLEFILPAKMALKPGTPVFWHTLYVLQNNKTQIELRLRKPEIKVVFFQSQKEHIEQNHELI